MFIPIWLLITLVSLIIIAIIIYAFIYCRYVFHITRIIKSVNFIGYQLYLTADNLEGMVIGNEHFINLLQSKLTDPTFIKPIDELT